MVRQYFTPQYTHPSNKFTDSVMSKEYLTFLVELDTGVETGFDAGVWINLVQHETGFGQ